MDRRASKKNMIKNLLSKHKRFLRYGLVTLGSQMILFLLTILAVEWLNMPATYSYAVVLALVYIGVFVANTHYVFETGYAKKNVYAYLLFITGFWIFNNSIFSWLVHYYNIHYVAALLINIVILGLVRYYLQKNYIFKR